MEIKQPESVANTDNTNNTVFTDISLDNVAPDFKRTYTRNRGTLGQLVYSLNDMIERLNEPMNDYQKILYPKIQTECKTVIETYNTLVSSVQPSDYYVVGYYLNGSRNNGKRKPTTSQYERKSYSVSEYRETLKSMNDRLRHIKYDCIRKSRDTTRTNQEVFQRMIVFCDEYHRMLNTQLDGWKTFIQELHNTNGISPRVKVVNKANTTGRQTREQNKKNSPRYTGRRVDQRKERQPVRQFNKNTDNRLRVKNRNTNESPTGKAQQ